MNRSDDIQPNQPRDGDDEPLVNPMVVRRATVAAAVAVVTIIWLLLPASTNGASSGQWLSARPRAGLAGVSAFLSFIPYGVSAGWLASLLFRRQPSTVLLLAVDSFLLALVVETIQYWVGVGVSSSFDLAAHTLGGVAGACLGLLVSAPPEQQTSEHHPVS